MAPGATNEEWIAEVVADLGDYLAGQRWFHSPVAPQSHELSMLKATRLTASEETSSLWQVLVGVGAETYQMILGARANNEDRDNSYLRSGAAAPGAEEAGGDARPLVGESDKTKAAPGEALKGLVASTGGLVVHDALSDPELALDLLESISGGAQRAQRCRLITAEQSNTSLIYDDRLILKVFRRLRPGRNPDAEVTSALAADGFANVATPLLEWGDEDYDFAFGQSYLAGGADGWALALASLRDFYSVYSDSERRGPGDAGGDFGPEATRLGRVTARMHLHLSRIFPVGPSETVAGSWEGLIESIRRRLASASGALGRDLEGLVASLLERVSGLEGPGPVIRVHGDLHLGQVMRTDLGWFVLDFEGEPDRSLAERLAPASPLKDVAGMLRSLHYASRYSLGERDRSEWGHLHSAALAWEQRNREAFLAGYESQPGIEVLLPDAYAMSDVMSVYELDKALYELAYELAHRPEWVEIPMDALERLGLPDERSID